MAYYSRTRVEDVAAQVSALTYAEMVEIATDLRSLITEHLVRDEDDKVTIYTSAICDILSGWAGTVNAEMLVNKKKVENP